MINYESKAINLHAEVYGWLYRALEEMVKAEIKEKISSNA